MRRPIKNSLCLSILFSALLTACGGGGGGGGGSSTPPSGSLAIAEVDTDHNGLIEISSLEQLDWIRNNPDGTSLIDFQHQANSKGCPTSGCFGYELVADLDFDTNGDGVINSSDAYFDYEKNGTNAGWLPIPRFTATFEGNGHHIRNLFINRPNDSANYSTGLFALIIVNPNAIAKIQNLVFDGPLSSVTGRLYAGALAGQVDNGGQLTISHVTQSGKIKATGSLADGKGIVSSAWYAGGIIGDVTTTNGSALIIDSNSATSIVDSPHSYAGGLISLISSSTTNQIIFTNNSSSSHVTGSSTGGLVSTLSLGDTPTIFTNNSSAGLVEGEDAGGLIGYIDFRQGAFSDNHSSAAVTGTGTIGGLIGSLNCEHGAYVEESYATGSVTGNYTVTNSGGSENISGGATGGLIGSASVPAEGVCGLKRSFASGAIIGGNASGGLIGEISPAFTIPGTSTGAFELVDNFSSGPVTAYLYAGGIAGNINLYYEGGTVTVTNNLALGSITASTSHLGFGGGIAGNIYLISPSTVSLVFSHWASDTTTAATLVANTSGSIATVGNLATSWSSLACPISANNFSCAAGELFHSWDTSLNSQGQPVWDFGNAAQLPGLKIGNSVHRPVYDGSSYSISVEGL